MKVSIITTAYNSGATIRQTIESVLSQDYRDIEYIIIDGASTDHTMLIVSEYGNRISCVVSEPDAGIYDAMNKGIRMATGDIIGILNSDDVYADDRVLADVVQCFESAKVDAVFAGLCFVKPDNLDAVVRIWKGSAYSSGAFRRGWHPAHPTFFVKRMVYERFGIFDLSFSVSADFELMLRLIEKHRIPTYFLDRIIVKMRMGGLSTGSLKNILKGNWNILRAFKKNGIYPSVLYPFLRIMPKVWNMLKMKLKIG